MKIYKLYPIQYTTASNVYLGNNTCIRAVDESVVKLPTENNVSCPELHKIIKILYIPKLAKNLFSVPDMIKMWEAKITFENEHYIVSKDVDRNVVHNEHG